MRSIRIYVHINHIGMNKINNTEFFFFTISDEKKMRRLWIRLFSIWKITLSIYYLSQCVMPNVVTDKKEKHIADKHRKHANNYSNCSSKVTKLGLLKIHKCASTTLQNILIRYAIFNELNVVLTNKGSYINALVSGIGFNRSMIEDTLWN